MRGFSQFGINANLCCYVCVCLSVDIALKLLLYRTSTEKYNETYRQTESDIFVVVACCACEWNRQHLTLITVIPCVREYMYTQIYLNIHTNTHVCTFVMCLLCGCFLYLCNCSLLSFSPIYCNCVVARSRAEKAVSLLIIRRHMCACICAYLCGNVFYNV